VFVRIKKTKIKPILLISNDDCFILKKKDFPDKKLNNFIINNKNVNRTGKIIIENEKFFTQAEPAIRSSPGGGPRR
jgi:sporulation protein YlmC with PRC-barrel domain